MDTVPKSVTKRKPPAKGGSRKGIPNKTTAAIKDMVLQALDESGGVRYLKTQAKKNPVAFMGLLAKVMPTQVSGAGPNGEHMMSWSINFVKPGGGR